MAGKGRFKIVADSESSPEENKITRIFKPGTILGGAEGSGRGEGGDDDYRGKDRKRKDPEPEPKPEERLKSKYFDANQSTDSVAFDPKPGPSSSNEPTTSFVVNPVPNRPVGINSEPSFRSNNVLVNRKQTGNPLLKSIRNWSFSDIEPDYVLGQSAAALFLSLKYHNLYPNYIYDRLKFMGKSYHLRVLLVLVDINDPNAPLKELAKMSVMAEVTLMLGWSSEEIARYIGTYKGFEGKSPSIIMEKQLANSNGTEGSYKCVAEALASVRKVNRSDAIALISTFESLERIVKAPLEHIGLCPGIGPQKAQTLHELFYRPFIRS